MSEGIMVQEAKRKSTKKKKVVATKKIHELVGHDPDPCTYQSSDKFISSSLVGVEIELEGMNGLRIDNRTFSSYWRETEDGSLRDGGREYVLSRPFAGKDLEKALSLFDKHVAKSGHKIRVSDRTSVHVHIDVRDLTYEQLTRLVCIYAIFEDALFNLVGKERANNIFSTSLSNAEGNLKTLGVFGEDPNNAQARSVFINFTKYSACNISAVSRYGSLEFRNHEGTYDIERIIKWINILLLLKEAAIGMEIPVQEIFSNISSEGTQSFFNDVFKEYSQELDYPNLEFDMYNGLRLAQDIIYSQKLDSSITVPECKDSKESVFAKYYKKRKPKRFNDRYASFIKSIENGGVSWEEEYITTQEPPPHLRGFGGIAGNRVRMRINERYREANFALGGE